MVISLQSASPQENSPSVSVETPFQVIDFRQFLDYFEQACSPFIEKGDENAALENAGWVAFEPEEKDKLAERVWSNQEFSAGFVKPFGAALSTSTIFYKKSFGEVPIIVTHENIIVEYEKSTEFERRCTAYAMSNYQPIDSKIINDWMMRNFHNEENNFKEQILKWNDNTKQKAIKLKDTEVSFHHLKTVSLALDILPIPGLAIRSSLQKK